jgi:hypothetical protein
VSDRPSTLAWCRQCNSPLVFTFIVPRCEWYCVTCGGAWPFLGEPSVNATEKRLAKADDVKAQFIEAAKGLIVAHSKHEGCPLCFGPEADGTYHREHATPEQIAASDTALATLIWLQTKRRAVA